MRKRLLILDGSSLMFRAFYALPPLTAANGAYTNAIFGFSNMLLKLFKDWAPDEIAVAFDKSRHTFRTELYPEYKGTRDKTPEEFVSQIPLLKELLAAWGIAFLELDDFEADDIIGTLAKKRSSDGDTEVFVVTGDRDALQLIDDNVKVIFTKKGISETIVYDRSVFEQEYGFEPIKLIDLKGLMGDSSDNIPGIPGVGPKTASKLLLEYKSLEAVLENAEKISGKKLQEKLITNRDLALLSKQLATIDCKAPVDVDNITLTVAPKLNELRDFCQKYNLRSVLKALDEMYTVSLFDEPGSVAEMDFVNIESDNMSDLTSLLASCQSSDAVAVAAAYSGRVPHLQIDRLAVAVVDKAFLVVDSQVISVILTSIVNSAAQVVFFDAKPFLHVNKQLPKKYHDLKLVAYLLDPEANDYTLDRLVGGYGISGLPAVPSNDDVSLVVWQAEAIYRLKTLLLDRMTDLGLTELYSVIDLPLIRVLYEMEETGIYVNSSRLAEQSRLVSERLAKLQKEIYEIAKEEFNINSPKQLGIILFEKLGLPAGKKTKTGYSTNVEVLNQLIGVHPIIERILAFRTWTKLKTTYLDALPELIDQVTGRVHTSFNQLVTATGRLSSSEPNLQNIPVRKEEGREVRTSFEPSEGYDYLLSADYSQIELRVLAHLSQDANFLSAFQNGEDVHARTAAEVFGLPIEEVTPEQRRRAKAVNFGIVYGISDYGLAQDLHISRKEAGEYIAAYFNKCSGVKEFIDATVAEAHRNGYVTTMYGRRRDLPAIHSSNFNQRSLAERMAMNTPIQGSAADIIKLAMISAAKKLKEAKLKSRILLQVHDELVLEVPESEKETVAALLKECMEKVAVLSVPLEVDIHWGKNWAEAK